MPQAVTLALRLCVQRVTPWPLSQYVFGQNSSAVTINLAPCFTVDKGYRLLCWTMSQRSTLESEKMRSIESDQVQDFVIETDNVVIVRFMAQTLQILGHVKVDQLLDLRSRYFIVWIFYQCFWIKTHNNNNNHDMVRSYSCIIHFNKSNKTLLSNTVISEGQHLY